MGAVDKLSGEELEDDQLGGEQDHESGDQRPRSQEGHVREKSSKLVRGKGWDRELGRRPSRRLGKLVDDHRREHHAEERTDEENPPLVVEQVSEPTPPPRGVLRRVAECDSRRPDLSLFPAKEPADEPNPTTHPIPLSSKIPVEKEIRAGGEQGKTARAARLGS